MALLKYITCHLAVLTPAVWSYKRSASTNNINSCHCLCVKEFSGTPLLHTRLHVRHHFIRLPFFCHLSYSNKMLQNIGRKVLLLSWHLPLTLWTSVINGWYYFHSSPSMLCLCVRCTSFWQVETGVLYRIL